MSDTVSSRSVVVASKDQVSSDLGGEAAILNLKAGAYYGLDEVGGRIWTLIQKPRSVAEVRDILVDEYEVEPDRCERDLVELLQRLKQEELVEIRYEASS